MIIDTHAHYDDSAFDADRDSLLHSMGSGGIGCIVNVCASMDSLDRVPALIRRYPFMYGAVGIHPDDAPALTVDVLEKIRSLVRDEKILAVGEIGLDYYWHKEEAEHRLQKEVFRAQLELSREAQLPFMVHSRDACADTLEIVRSFVQSGMYGGIIHCFSYSVDTAREYLNLGLYLGIGGVVTYKNGRKLKEVVEYAPLSQLVLETDAPYLAPVPYRGTRNSSLYLPLVVQEIARLKKISPEEVIRVTTENAENLLGMKSLSGSITGV